MRFATTGLMALLVPLLVLPGMPSAVAGPVARADMGQDGRLCFPLRIEDTGEDYDVCLQLNQLTPEVQFSLVSVTPAQHQLADLPLYSQSTGLRIPLARLVDGRVFSNIEMEVEADAATGAFRFNVTSAERVHLPLDKSVARLWNEALLESIRNDFARPTVHARNLFHVSAAIYDAWAVLDEVAEPWLLGKTEHGFTCPFTGMPAVSDRDAVRREAISYAAYRIMLKRFASSPGFAEVSVLYRTLMNFLGYDITQESRDYSTGSGAALGNHIADCMLAYGLQDGANEAAGYANRYYQPVNQPMVAAQSGNPTMTDPDRWQPLSFEEFRDQSGNLFAGITPAFVGPEWGSVLPFSLQATERKELQRDGSIWQVYHDPGSPPRLSDAATEAEYRWGFELVAIWSSQLDPADGVLIDISPGAIGNIAEYPETLADYHQFYNLTVGGETSRGHELNPVTGKPYAPQLVPRADYARVLAEFWADGPDSETPPGHWFTILNYVSDHPQFEKRWRGKGAVVDALEWDVKSYFALGGAMHDVAVATWGIKGYYDYVRPVSALRYMAGKGQNSDPALPSWNPEGVTLVPGYIELVTAADPLATNNSSNIGKIKFRAWRGPDFIADPGTDYAGVDWILAENWWPYQRPTFVTPPFAGYISGHSTFSRAAADLMTLMTGNEFFPGGMGEFVAKKNAFLVFEEGPSVDVILQWATYRDASDQTSLSRIWGGIHPPADDIPGRRLGSVIGPEAFVFAERYMLGTAP
jgi:hypothetical protein